jgi:GAF domain-containing protein
VTPVGSAKAPESFGAPSQAGLDETSASSPEPLSRAVEQVMTHQETVVQLDMSAGTGQAALVVPISLRGEVIGALGLHETEGGRQWAEDEIALVEAVADQMALALENARLLEETQQRARRDRLIADITARVRSSRDPETILRTAVRELGAALGTDRARVQIGTGIQPSDK